MRPIATDRTVTSTLEGEKASFGIDADSAEHLMGLLTDLYSDRERAVLRELSTNARDSHLEAGNDAPIEIELPSALRPVLVIRDYGVGLDLDELRRVYTQYGASTKRDSDTATGMLGLGGKSPLTYTDSYTLVATKNGVRVHAAVAKNEKGVGELTVVNTERDASYPNGVEITVPSKRQNEFSTKAADLFAYWPEGSVLVNGKPPARIGGTAITDDILIVDTSGDQAGYTNRRMRRGYSQQRHTVVMGGVPYPANIDHDDLRLAGNYSIVAYVPMGSVHFTPSREELMDTSRTQQTLAGVACTIIERAKAAASKAISEAPSKSAALAAFAEWRGIGLGATVASDGTAGLTWRGETLPTPWNVNPYGIDGSGSPRVHVVKKLRYSSEAKSTCDTPSQLDPVSWPKSIFVTGFKPSKFSAPHRRKLAAWAEANGYPNAEDFPRFVLTDVAGLPSNVHAWIDGAKVLDWADLRKIKTTAGSGTSSVTATGEAYEEHPAMSGRSEYAPNTATLHDAAALASTPNPVYYFAPPARSSRWGTDYAAEQKRQADRLIAAGGIVLRMPANRQAKFLRLVPNAQEGSSAVRATFDAWKASVPEDQWTALTSSIGRSWLRNLDPAALLDPALRALVEKAKRIAAVKVPDDTKASFDAWANMRYCASARTFDPTEDEAFAPYLLASRAFNAYRGPDSSEVPHLVEYCNAIFTK